MPNALSAGTTPPPPPDIRQQTPLGSGGPPAPPGAPQAPAPPPAPSQAQTVAALRHFDAIARETSALLKDPDCGKTDMKSEVIDGVTKLVSKGMMTAPDAVQTLGTFPEKPFDQRKWPEQKLTQADQAAEAVLTHHAAAFQGMATPPGGAQLPSADDHIDDVKGMMQQHYRKPNA